MRTREIRWIFIGLGLVTWLSHARAAEGPSSYASFQKLAQYTRLQVPAANGATFRLINNGEGPATATLVVDRVRPGSLAPLTQYTDERVSGVSVKPTGIDQAEVTIHFRNPATQSFAYHQGSSVVLDVWKSDKAKAVGSLPAAVKKAPVRSLASVAPVKKKAAAKPIPKVEPISREADLFQHFVLPMPELRVEAKNDGPSLPPTVEIEGLWKFSPGDKNTDEGKAYEFIKSLFQKKSYGLAVKAIEIDRAAHPKSPYKDEIRFLEALSYRRLAEMTNSPSLTAKAEEAFEELGNERNEKGEPLPFHRALRLFFGEREYAAGKYLEAIPHLEYVAKVTDHEDREFPYLQMMLAECYGKVGQSRRAERVYHYIAEKFPTHILAKESLYRVADLLAGEKNYGRVVEEAENALHRYPEHEKARAEVLFQLGEAHFWLKNYAEAEKYMRRYAEVSSAQTNAALAWARIGEIREVSKGDMVGAKAAYEQAKNGYPFSAGDQTATVRLARIDQLTDKDPEFVMKRLKEIQADRNSDEDLRRMSEIAMTDYLLAAGEREKALDIASNGMAQTEGTPFEAYKHAYVKATFSKLQSLVKEKKMAEALALYDKQKKWVEMAGPEYLRTMAEAYRGLGLYATANEMMEKYSKSATGRGPASVSGRQALELSQAKNSFARGSYAETLKALPDSEDPEILAMQAISEYRLGHKRDAYGSAAKALANADPDDLGEGTLGDLMEICMDWDTQDNEFARMERDLNTLATLLKGDNERLAFARGDALWYQKKHEAAAKVYQAALEKFPKGERADRARYNLGMSYIELGRNEDAVKVLTGLRDSGQNIWAESAKQELELMGWEKKYSSVLKTLPPSGLGITN